MSELRILLVEDCEDDAALVLRELERNGYLPQHRRVETAAELLDALQQSWDVVLADFSMPRFSGARALELLRTQQHDEPFIVVSGTIGEERAAQAMRSGAQDYVSKDNLSRLVPVIERAISEARTRRSEKELQEQLIHAQKLEAVGRVAGGVAHDFNNLLTIIMGFAELLQEKPNLSDDMREAVNAVRSAAERAAVLTRQLLAFSRKQVAEPVVLDVCELIRSTEKMLRRLVGEDVAIECRLEADPRSIFADRGQLEQVLFNLAVNARDAMPAGGLLAISARTRRLSSESPAAEGIPPTADWVELEVRDTGTGMSDEVRSRIFEPFFTTKEEGRGTGLGLPICRTLVEAAGGRMTVESTLGEGTEVTILLPCTAESPAVRRANDASSRQGRERILLVEDDDGIRKVLSRTLGALGYRLIEAADYAGAATVLDDPSIPLDLLISDAVLPDGAGAELAELGVALRPGLEVLFITGYAEEARLRRSSTSRAALLRKPFTPSAIAEKVRELLDSAQPPPGQLRGQGTFGGGAAG